MNTLEHEAAEGTAFLLWDVRVHHDSLAIKHSIHLLDLMDSQTRKSTLLLYSWSELQVLPQRQERQPRLGILSEPNTSPPSTQSEKRAGLSPDLIPFCHLGHIPITVLSMVKIYVQSNPSFFPLNSFYFYSSQFQDI